jgi:hypothetical protein
MPVCARCEKKAKSRGNTGAYIGLAAWAIAGILLVVISNSGLPPQDTRLIAGMITSVTFFAIGLIAILVGVLMQRATTNRLVAHIDDATIWMRDISPAYLKSLPAWTGESLERTSCASITRYPVQHQPRK